MTNVKLRLPQINIFNGRERGGDAVAGRDADLFERDIRDVTGGKDARYVGFTANVYDYFPGLVERHGGGDTRGVLEAACQVGVGS